MRKVFYLIKPLIPRRLQIYLRRMLAQLKRRKYSDTWPILKTSNKKPDGWDGWMDNKKFAFILTHDVELQKGHDRVKALVDIEKKYGFVSSYNFVPERYNVSTELRKFLESNGFEVGVHGLNHDGKLFNDHQTFSKRAEKINKYIEDWNVVGFRAPAMHHNLEWIKKLNIKYDLSTFDTDPFEPQADGVGTIFPFRVGKKGEADSYIELPYTLVQDFTLFILFKERDIEIWKKKIDWIVENEGMVLVNVHPDYTSFENNENEPEEFPVRLYEELLEYITSRYSGQFWNATPNILTEFWENNY